jgi:pimeloyl-ACP methyl ester carboxylesterase
MITHRHRAILVSAALLAFATQTESAPSTAVEVTDLAYITPHQLVDIGGGRKMNIYCVGHGSPTVIFDAGLGDQIRAWAAVGPEISKRTRACAYDRAGLGFSDPSNRAGSAENSVDDLHKLLSATSIAPPYILVGHSLGGMYVRLFADHYRSEVVGMVLVDPVSEDQGSSYSKLDPATKTQNTEYVEAIHDKCIHECAGTGRGALG